MFKTLIAVLLSFVAAVAMAATDVNKASQAELETISGIGPSMSTKIIDARKAGSFKNWTDLTQRVKGIGDGNSKKYSANGLTVSGAAYDGTAFKRGAAAKGDAKSQPVVPTEKAAKPAKPMSKDASAAK